MADVLASFFLKVQSVGLQSSKLYQGNTELRNAKLDLKQVPEGARRNKTLRSPSEQIICT